MHVTLLHQIQQQVNDVNQVVQSARVCVWVCPASIVVVGLCLVC